MSEPLSRRLFAEALGAAFLLATVIGSGIMGERLAGGNVVLALLGNTLPTGVILVVLILIFGPVSGAHFNPAVSLAFALRGEFAWSELAPYIAAQLAGGVLGVFVRIADPANSTRAADQASGWRKPSQASGCCSRFSVASRVCRRPRLTQSASISLPPTGSPPRPLSPIRL